jgi:hypothetical protein
MLKPQYSSASNVAATAPNKRTGEGNLTGGEERMQRPAIPTPLESYVHTLMNKFPSVAGKTRLVNLAQQDKLFGYKLASAFYIQDMKTFRSRVLPTPPVGVSINRDERKFITSISDESAIVKGPKLDRLVMNYGASLSGYELVIYSHKLDDPNKNNDGLVIPAMNLVPYQYEHERADGHLVSARGYTSIQKTQVTHFLIPYEDVSVVLGMSALPITQLPSILRTLSNLRKNDPDFDITSLTGLATITAARANPDCRRAHVALLDSLEAAFLEGSTIDEKISAFRENPSFTFLAKLKLRRPYSKLLFDANGKPVTKSKLSQLPLDSQILLQDLVYDGNYYERSLNENMTVYAKGNYNVRVGKQMKQLGVLPTMRVRDILRLVEAKEAADKKPNAVSTTAPLEEDSSMVIAEQPYLNFDI